LESITVNIEVNILLRTFRP